MIFSDKDKKLLLSRAEDTVRLALKNYSVKAFGFLTPYERMVIEKNLYSPAEVSVVYFGGYDNAERTFMLCIPEYTEVDYDEFLSVISITGRDTAKLTHRDYLGSLLGLGITRENIGDILVSEDGAFVFVKTEICDFVKNNLDKVGRVGVHTEHIKCSDAKIPPPKTRSVKGTVQSYRLDAILSAATGMSRTRSAEMIKQGKVCVNWEEIEAVSYIVKEGDLLSVRGFGRMKLSQIGGTTRKGRNFVTIEIFE